MRMTGTNELMDLWSDIQYFKNLAISSNRGKMLVTDKYIKYKKMGGKKRDIEIEDWRKNNEKFKS